MKRYRHSCSTIFLLIAFLSSGLLSARQEPDNRTQIRLATEFERLGQFDRAADIYYGLFQAAPGNVTYYSGLRRNLERLGRYSELVRIIRQRLELGDDIGGRADLGSALFKNAQEGEARREWQRVLAQNPRNTGAFTQVASAMLQNSLFDDAIAVYLQGREALNSPDLFAIELGNTYVAKMQYDLATREFLRYLDSNNKQFPYVQRRILSLFTEEMGDAVLAEVERHLRSSTNPPVDLLQLYADCLKKMERYGEALAVHVRLEELAAQRPNYQPGRELYSFAQEMATSGHGDIAGDAYALLLERTPASPFRRAAQLGIAEAQMDAGKYNEALAAVEALLQDGQQNPYMLRAFLLRGELLLYYLNRPQDALEMFTLVKSRFRQPDAQRAAMLAIADAHRRLGNAAQAASAYAQALSLAMAGGDAAQRNTIHFHLAEMAFMNRQFTRAISLLEKVEPTAALSPGERALRNDALELTLLIEENLADSTTVLGLYADARALQIRGQANRAADSLNALVQRYPASALAPRALLEIAEVHERLGQMQQRKAALKQVIEAYPAAFEADEATYVLALALEKEGSAPEAMRYYEKLLVDYPYSTYLEKARARIRSLREAGTVPFQN